MIIVIDNGASEHVVSDQSYHKKTQQVALILGELVNGESFVSTLKGKLHLATENYSSYNNRRIRYSKREAEHNIALKNRQVRCFNKTRTRNLYTAG